MQITVSNGEIRISRYGGTIGKGEDRKTLSSRIGSFPDIVQPEFQSSATDANLNKIPYAIYRKTTPEEHDELIAFVQRLRMDEAQEKIRALTEDLRGISRLLKNVRLEPHDADALASACSEISRALRHAKTARSTAAQSPEAQRDEPYPNATAVEEVHTGGDTSPVA